ncbi:aminotransferase, class III [Lophiotrema nucula]|uniref:Aminotransferase, class III n=1 Tax=Lophiotrema nucula TaxID=690887 RepID=A0A6A5ZLN6_9PLEO|nr:aminotransferase, class III [Lophiotrema nucula]
MNIDSSPSPPILLLEENAAGADSQSGLAHNPFQDGVLHRHMDYQPPSVEEGGGCWLYLEDGTRVFDGSCGAAVSSLGHGEPRIIDAISRQLNKVGYLHSGHWRTRATDEYCNALVESTDGAMAKALVLTSGSNSVEACLKMGIQFFRELPIPQTKRVNFIARAGSYHGTSLATLSVGGHLIRRRPYEQVLSKVGRVSACNEYRNRREGESRAEFVARLARELDDEFVRLGGDTVAAFIVEPVVGAALGYVPAVPGYLRAMKDVCKKHGALIIYDEVMCGMGRTGYLHAWQKEKVAPDLQAIGKGMAAGYFPCSAMLLSRRVAEVLYAGSKVLAHGETFQMHPVACAASLEVLRILRNDELLNNVLKQGAFLKALLETKVGRLQVVGNIRGDGLMVGVELVRDRITKEPFPAEDAIAERILEKAKAKPYSLALYNSVGCADGFNGDCILISPPFIINEDEVKHLVDTFYCVLVDFFKVPLSSSL